MIAYVQSAKCSARFALAGLLRFLSAVLLMVLVIGLMAACVVIGLPAAFLVMLILLIGLVTRQVTPKSRYR